MARGLPEFELSAVVGGQIFALKISLSTVATDRLPIKWPSKSILVKSPETLL